MPPDDRHMVAGVLYIKGGSDENLTIGSDNKPYDWFYNGVLGKLWKN